MPKDGLLRFARNDVERYCMSALTAACLTRPGFASPMAGTDHFRKIFEFNTGKQNNQIEFPPNN